MDIVSLYNPWVLKFFDLITLQEIRNLNRQVALMTEPALKIRLNWHAAKGKGGRLLNGNPGQKKADKGVLAKQQRKPNTPSSFFFQTITGGFSII
jgi:hypothetical protein